MHFNIKQILLQFFLILLISAGISAEVLNVKLKNGRTYEGELSFENSFVCIITIDNISNTIQKADIAFVNGRVFIAGSELKTYIKTAEPVQEVMPQPQQQGADTSVIDYSGKRLSITLKNGMIFNGTVISDKGKMLLLNRDGAPVNLYKSTIARIAVEGEVSASGTVPSKETPVIKTEPAKKSEPLVTNIPVTKSEPVVATPPDTKNEPVVNKVPPIATEPPPASGTVPSGKPVVNISSFDDEQERPSTPAAENVPQKQPQEIEQKKAAPDIEQKVEPASEVAVANTVHNSKQSPVPEPLPVKEQKDVQIATAPLPSVPAAQSTQPIHVPENVFIPSAIPVSDGRRTILLKNGTIFKGKVLSEDERFVTIDSDGTSLNILKKVIKSIDGAPYRLSSTVKPLPSPATADKQKISVKKETFSGRRPKPVVSVNENVTSAMLIDSLKSSSWECRSRACRMLGAMGDWAISAVPSLGQRLSDTSQSQATVPVWIDTSDVRRLLAPSLEAARALAYLGDNGYRTIVNGLGSTDAIVRRSAVFGLLEFPDDNAKTDILFKMLRDKNGSVRAIALGAFCNPSNEQLLIDALKDDETAVRCNAALLLGKLRSERALPELEKLLSDIRSVVRAHAVEAIGAIGSVNSSSKIIGLLEDPNFNVREKTVEALGFLGDTIATLPLINALRDVNPDVRGAAATALSFIRDPRAIPSLYSLLKDENATVREKARNSLRLHTELKQLIDGLSDQSTTVRENASYVLWLLTGKDFGNDPEKWKQWYEQQGKKRVQ
jgi:HEAT repeat protein/small nuclear ribonucleoprotein (snRNP)-like protein